MSRLALGLVALLAVPLASCSGSVRAKGTQVEYSVSARQNYERGMKRLGEEEWAEAAKYFTFVKARYPYSKYAVLSELRIADTIFGAGAYLEAIDNYRQFMKFHPTHEMVVNGYAAYRIGESFFKMLPDSWFLTPPAYEMDMASSLDAMRELTDFLRRYPKSPYVEKVEKMRKKAAHLLAAHEWYVARFYWRRNRPMGTVLRLRTLLAKYPGVGYDEEALWLLGQAYVKVGRPADARETWTTLITKHPTHKRAQDARRALSNLKG